MWAEFNVFEKKIQEFQRIKTPSLKTTLPINNQHNFSATYPAFGSYPIAHGGYGFPNGGAFYFDERQPVGTVFAFYCYDPYQIISGTSRLTCTAAGTWSSDPPTCEMRKALLLLSSK